VFDCGPCTDHARASLKEWRLFIHAELNRLFAVENNVFGEKCGDVSVVCLVELLADGAMTNESNERLPGNGKPRGAAMAATSAFCVLVDHS
jgi:hypothetical protein